VYRFFAWGMIPIGLAVGGLVVEGAETFGMDRVMALRLPYFVTGAALFVLFFWAAPQLTTEKIESARAEGIAQKEKSRSREQSADGE